MIENLLPSISESVYLQLFQFLLIMVGGIVVTRFFLVPLASRLASRNSDSKKIAQQTRNLVGLVGLFFSFILALQVGEFGSLVTILGTIVAALTVAIGFGMREMVGNLVAGVFIHVDNPFVRGDYIQIGENEGEVKDITLRYTLLNGHRSETIEVPNGLISTQALRNYTRGTRTKTSAQVKVKPEKVDVAVGMLEEAARQHEKVLQSPAPNVRVQGFEDAKALLELHYWTRDSDDYKDIKSKVLAEFSEKAADREIFPEK